MTENTLKTDWVQDIAAMHTKFGVNTVVRGLDKEKLSKFLQFRLDFLQEELDEAKEALASGEVDRAEDVVDAMIDLCVVAIGTLDAFDVNAYEAWNRVHGKNMEKTPGIKPERPNPLGLPDLIKPAGWTAPTHADNVGILARVF
jgi:predicted HAD superfamily Cof-like phosphohydrolase